MPSVHCCAQQGCPTKAWTSSVLSENLSALLVYYLLYRGFIEARVFLCEGRSTHDNRYPCILFLQLNRRERRWVSGMLSPLVILFGKTPLYTLFRRYTIYLCAAQGYFGDWDLRFASVHWFPLCGKVREVCGVHLRPCCVGINRFDLTRLTSLKRTLFQPFLVEMR